MRWNIPGRFNTNYIATRLEKRMKRDDKDRNRDCYGTGTTTNTNELFLPMSAPLHAFCEQAFSIAHGKDFRRIMGPRCRPSRRTEGFY